MNVIIPLCGLGERFKKDGYTAPKPLIRVFGKQMIFHVLDNLKLDAARGDQLYIIYRTDLDKHDFRNVVRARYPATHFIPVDRQTKGAAETLWLGLSASSVLSAEDLQRPTVVADADTYYTVDILDRVRRRSAAAPTNPFAPERRECVSPYHVSDPTSGVATYGQANSVFCFKDEGEKPIYSYVTFKSHSDPVITEIREKVKISDYANSGCYCFASGELLRQYCKKVLDENITEKGEPYTSCVIRQMMQEGHVFVANVISATDFHCLGTPFQVQLHCSQRATQMPHPTPSPPQRFCFDLDNTLVTAPTVKDDYTTVQPIQRNIEFLRFLKSMGHTIILHTARRMRTMGGNVGKVVKDVGKITLDTLDRFNIPYDELFFGKPQADFYIDDLAVSAYADLEKETGFYKTSLEERDFNQISETKLDVIVKRSATDKLRGEIYYYQNMPASVRHLFPVFIHSGKNFYTVEKINGITLSYLYVNESMTPALLLKMLECLDTLHQCLPASKTNVPNICENYCPKIKQRYLESGYNYAAVSPHAETIYQDLMAFFAEYEATQQARIGVIHGDPVFSNCLLDSSNNLKWIDMRGMIGNECTLFGDVFYDYAKIYQSLIGYDEILLERVVKNEYKLALLNTFESYITNKFGGQAMTNIRMITNSLLFTLLPLHRNDKCERYFGLIR